ncbi:TIGR01459 family HAD-type hydrolase [Pararhodospirillum oryzae]|uniref:Haloacid dehalogenase n=1 Tax=Pararhodospirillum oryzae TaxID=478448 RepID=A0A512H7Z7_9PROT|nr:TIGR01459 family HAD-type hydrolase [Pararhodospirillum oryzae]GEO81573.1 haloacid dehalogenase [Pararhodospirillum oryzae]
MSNPVVACLPGLASLADRYDGFLLDLWGVIHDGERPYPGAVETLATLKARGQPCVLVSNAPRLGRAVGRTMAAMGIGSDLYRGIVTSGDAVNADLREAGDPAIRALGACALFIGPERDFDILEGTKVERTDDPARASFVLNTGPVDLDETEDAYRGLLERCAARGLPMLCANPDRAVIRGGRVVMCAGALADVYAGLGQSVIYRGKPDPALFVRARAALGLPAGARVAVVGDGLATDLPGAAAAGLDALFVTGGLNARALGVRHGEAADPARVRDLLARHGVAPVAAIPAFVWGEGGA